MDILTVVAMPLVTAIVGFTINSSLNERQQKENNLRLYADMMTRREQADSDLRKDMFQSILQSFTAPGKNDPQSLEALQLQVVNLELLAYNFNDSIDLGPLFKHVRRMIPTATQEPDAARRKRFDDLRHRLETVASEISERQLTVVGDSGMVVRAGVDSLRALPSGEPYIRFIGPTAVLRPDAKTEDSVNQVCLNMASSEGVHFRRFRLDIAAYDEETREIQILLYVSQAIPQEQCQSPALDLTSVVEINSKFRLDPFDFPMVDNTRLTHSERCALTLTNLGSDHGEIVLSYFPSSRASLKDKPYFDELEHELKGSGKGK